MVSRTTTASGSWKSIPPRIPPPLEFFEQGTVEGPLSLRGEDLPLEPPALQAHVEPSPGQLLRKGKERLPGPLKKVPWAEGEHGPQGDRPAQVLEGDHPGLPLPPDRLQEDLRFRQSPEEEAVEFGAAEFAIPRELTVEVAEAPFPGHGDHDVEIPHDDLPGQRFKVLL